RYRGGFGLFDQTKGGSMEITQFRFPWFVFGELHQVAAFEKFAKTFFLVARQQLSSLQFIKELLGSALRCSKIKPLLQVPADGIGHQNAEFPRLTDESQRFLK